MNCTFIKEHLFAFHEGLLEPQAAIHYRSHLQECDSCKDLDEVFAASIQNATSRGTFLPNPFLSTRIMQRLDDEFLQPSRMPSWVKIVQPALLTAALVAGILIGSMTARRTDATQAPSASTSIQELRSDMFIQSFAEETHIDELSK